MPPRMMTRSAGRSATASRGGGTGGRTGRGGGRTGSRSVDQGNGRNDGQGGQGSEVNARVDGVPTSPPSLHSSCKIYFPLLNVIENNNHRGCTYKEFLAYNPKEYDGKGCDVVYTRWIKKMESVQDMSG
nr:reverse transcriptase domain-containing protein [Tanacetum cinerariifolium]